MNIKLTLIAFLFTGMTSVWSQSHIVYPDGSGTYPTIQAAVDAAADGDTILLADGEFTTVGNYLVHISNKDLVIRSESGIRENVVINPNVVPGEYKPVFLLDGGTTLETVLENFTIKRAGSYAQCPQCTGGAVIIENGGDVTIKNMVFTEMDCSLKGNTVVVHGGPSTVNISNSVFSKCGKGNLTTILSADDSNIFFYVDHCLFYDGGGGVYEGTHLIIDHCTIADFNSVPANIPNNQYYSLLTKHSINDNPLITVKNCIFQNSTIRLYTYYGNDIFSNPNNNCTIEHTNLFNVQNGWNGSIQSFENNFGNISSDAYFADQPNWDYHLTPPSPCNNSGDPTYQLDPDGTITEMGCFPFEGISTNGIVEETSQHINLYPNPATTIVEIDSKIINDSEWNAAFYSSLGELVKTVPVNKQTTFLKVDDLKNGTYFVKLSNEKMILIEKLVITK